MNRRFKGIKKKIRMNKFFLVILFLVVVVGVVLLVPSVFASLQPVKSIEILSSKSNYSSKEEGSWRVTNSVEFASSNTALVTMDLDTIAKGSSKKKDVVFLIDTSESMLDAKLSTLKSSLINSVNKILDKEGNNVALITFNNEATKISRLNNNKDEKIDCINNLTIGNGTSYYQALLEVENILKIYTLSKDREFNFILITDGAPSKDRPNDVALYKYLKDAYSFINIRGVQYEAGDKTLTELENVSDKQFVANKENLEKYLISSATSSNEYESFTIKENLNNDNFMVESINDIKVDYGSVSLNNNVVTWNLDNISSGSKAKMTLKAKQKNTSNGLYELNNNIEINSTIGGVNDEVTSTKTPVLSNNYKVKYDGNKSSDCTISGVPDEATHKVFETVSIADSPKCTGYQFKGWDIVTDNVTKINDDYFVMPEEDVELKANWSKLDIKKSTDGEVEEGWTLYKQVKSDAGSSNRYAKKYTGDTSTFTGNDDVYYYYGEAANNNVVFANYCWKIVRTTDTGGVKLLYNGVPTNGKCANTEKATALTKEQMGTSYNNMPYNNQNRSPADVGYMYNVRYESNSITLSSINQEKAVKKIIEDSNTEQTICMSSSYSYSNGKFILNNNNDDLNCTQLYRYISITDKLFCMGNTTTCDNAYLGIDSGKDDSFSYLAMSSDIFPLTLASNYTENSDGTYTLVNPKTYYNLHEFYFNNPNFGLNYKLNSDLPYICNNNKTTCSEVGRLGNINVEDNPYKYGNSFTYSNGIYKLVDTIRGTINSSHHYTCFNENGECSEINYIFYSHYGSTYHFIKLKEGKRVEDALSEMLYNNDVNKNSSNIKKAIDYWYSNNMTEYTKYLEDTVWCNDRSIGDKGGWNPNGEILNKILFFKSYYSFNLNDLICSNQIDRFTVDNTNGNGALTYPVGLITRSEQNLAYDKTLNPSSSLASGISFWSLSPYGFLMGSSNLFADNAYIMTSGALDNWDVVNYFYVRPAISLRMGIEYKSGDGSSDNPYVILTD